VILLPKSVFLLLIRVHLNFWKYFQILWSSACLHNMKVVDLKKLNNFYIGHFFIWALDQWQILVYSQAPELFTFYKQVLPTFYLQPCRTVAAPPPPVFPPWFGFTPLWNAASPPPHVELIPWAPSLTYPLHLRAINSPGRALLPVYHRRPLSPTPASPARRRPAGTAPLRPPQPPN